MKNVLILNSSPNGEFSVSSALSGLFQRKLSAAGDFNITVRDLGMNPPSHLTGTAISGFFSSPDQHSTEQQAALKESMELINEIQDADIVIIGSAMHNHAITSGLKAYFDQIARAGLTFKYGAKGPEGLLTGKQAYVITSAGGDYSEGFMQAMDFQTPYLKHILAFIGIKDVEFIPAHGGAMGEEIASKNRQIAEAKIAQVVKQLVQTAQTTGEGAAL